MTYAVVQIEPLQIVQVFPDTIPEPLVWPDGAISHAVHSGFRYGAWIFLKVTTTPDQPSEFHQIGEAKNTLHPDGLVIERTWVAGDIGKAKEILANRIDDQAETQRQKHLTSGVGQALVYHQKLVEATAIQSDHSPNLEKYPLLGATVGIDGGNLKEVASKVLSQSQKWSVKASEIERHRIGAKVAVNAAKSVEEAIGAAMVTWP